VCIIPSIGLLVFAIMVLVTGRATLTQTRQVQGRAARIVAVILMLPFPLALAMMGFMVFVLPKSDEATKELALRFFALESGFFFLCMLTAFVVALGTSTKIAARARPSLTIQGKATELQSGLQEGICPASLRPEGPDDERSVKHAGDVLGRLSAWFGLWSLVICPLAVPALVLGVIALILGPRRKWAIMGIVLGALMLLFMIAAGIGIYLNRPPRG
jgi:hypothetical protein